MYRVYKLVSKQDTNTVYIGSTTQKLYNRIDRHKQEAKRGERSAKKVNWILKNYDSLDIIEINSATNKDDALSIERLEILRHIEQGYNVLNTVFPSPPPPHAEQHITYELQYRRCGRAACSTCKKGQGHGPYWYAYWRDGERIRSRYSGKNKPA